MPAPKHNLFALGNRGGKPPIYKTEEELESKISAYFQYCVDNKEMPMVTTLTIFLGFSHINSLYDQRKRSEEFSGLINRALLCVMAGYERNLDTFKYGGAIFALTNMDKDNWKNAKTTDITTGGEKLTNNIDLKKFTPEELDLLESLLNKGKPK